MKSKNKYRYIAILIITVLSLSVSAYGCKAILSSITTQSTAQEQTEQQTEEKQTAEGQQEVGSETKLKAFETAHVYVEQHNPSASFESGYSEDKVVVESDNIFKVTIDFNQDGSPKSWQIILKYNEQDDTFSVVEAPEQQGEVAQQSSSEQSQQTSENQTQQTEETQQTQESKKQEPSLDDIKKRTFHTAQADIETMYSDVTFDTEYDDSKIKETSENKFEAVIEFVGLGQGATSKDHFTWKYQLQYDKEADKINILAKEFVSSYPVKKILTEDEIKKGAYNAAKEDVLKIYPNAVFLTNTSYDLIEALGNNYYQCFIIATSPGKQFLYLVRYDPNEGKWYTPFKTDCSKFRERSINAVKHYIETQDSWVQNKCNGVIFDINSVTGWSSYPVEDKMDKFTVKIKFQCQGKDGSSKWYEWAVKTRYDIFSDSFVEFDTSGNIL